MSRRTPGAAVAVLLLAWVLIPTSASTPAADVDAPASDADFTGLAPWTWCEYRLGSGGFCVHDHALFELDVAEEADVTTVRIQAVSAAGNADCTLMITDDSTTVTGTIRMIGFGSAPCEDFYAGLGTAPDTDLCYGRGRVGGLAEAPSTTPSSRAGARAPASAVE